MKIAIAGRGYLISNVYFVINVEISIHPSNKHIQPYMFSNSGWNITSPIIATNNNFVIIPDILSNKLSIRSTFSSKNIRIRKL